MSLLTRWKQLSQFRRRRHIRETTVTDKCLYCVHLVEKKDFDGKNYRRCALSGQSITYSDICNKFRQEKARVTLLQ